MQNVKFQPKYTL